MIEIKTLSSYFFIQNETEKASKKELGKARFNEHIKTLPIMDKATIQYYTAVSCFGSLHISLKLRISISSEFSFA